MPWIVAALCSAAAQAQSHRGSVVEHGALQLTLTLASAPASPEVSRLAQPVRPRLPHRGAASGSPDNRPMTSSPPTAFAPLPGIFEPSAIQQLPDGRFLVVEDEQSRPLSLLAISATGGVASTALTPGWLQMFSDFWKLDDLEGLARDSAGQVYAITSHSRDGEGDDKKARERLVRFRIVGDAVEETAVADGLKRALTAAHPVLAAAARVADVKQDGGLNIEGLAISPDAQRLLIGFRSPLQEGHAIIASVENVSAVFDDDAKPKVSPRLDLLDLDGNGIRGMSWVDSLSGYLVIGGPASRAQSPFSLWFWSGHHGAPARRVTVPGLPDFGHAEGVCPAEIDGVERIVIVSDDGNRKQHKPAHFLLLDPGQLQIAP